MNCYTFDIPLLASITIAANDPETARQMLQGSLEICHADFGAFSGEVSLTEDVDLYRHLGMVDGIDCTNQYGRRAI